MKKVLFLAPRLDVMFKEGSVPAERGAIPAVRMPWHNLRTMVCEEHRRRGDDVRVLELPLWQFTPQIVQAIAPDIAYIPHKMADNFPVPNVNVMYYMQTVIPYLFTIDSKGWGASTSTYPCTSMLEGDTTGVGYNLLRGRIFENYSKFKQPDHKPITLPKDYVLYLCQIPHDETIRYHSKITVEQAITATCQATKELGIPLVLKGHPVNPGSMEPLKQIANKYGHTTWLDDVSIHQLIPDARAVVVVNSGTGLESLLHQRPVITFGRADYDVVTNRVEGGNLRELLEKPKFNQEAVKNFVDRWYDSCYNTIANADNGSFSKLP